MASRDELAQWSIYIKGVMMPQDKAGIIEHARRNHAPENFLEALRRCPDKIYHTCADIGYEIGRLAPLDR